ncbi:MAG: hypothetical protein GX483_00640 [Actinomycetaceae bacterium]|nr:hypothetical protein [Actinomycetaceae bacterium]
MGSRGDGGCDGVAENGTSVYAVYSQTAHTDLDRKTANKLEKDFSRALENWPDMVTWRFITNGDFGPKSTQRFIELQKEHDENSPRTIKLELWKAPEDLWWRAVVELTEKQLDQVLPGVPHAQDVRLEDMVEVLQVLETETQYSIETFDVISPVSQTKMDFNNLSAATRCEFNAGRQLAPRLDKWFEAQPVGSRDDKAKRFNEIYQEIRKVTADPSEIVEDLYIALGGSNPRKDTQRANAVYAITAYFFDSCDIFENPLSKSEGNCEDATAD